VPGVAREAQSAHIAAHVDLADYASSKQSVIRRLNHAADKFVAEDAPERGISFSDLEVSVAYSGLQNLNEGFAVPSR
jgi:hypothetical protein